MRLKDLFEKVIDNNKGWGAVPFNKDVDYFGLKVDMKPSTFLNLAFDLPEDQRTSVDAIFDHLKNGGSVGAPFLDVEIPFEWTENADFSKSAKIRSHEGRNRMYALMKYQGDEPVEVHLFPRDGLRARHLTKEIIAELNKGIIKEQSTTYVRGPLFKI